MFNLFRTKNSEEKKPIDQKEINAFLADFNMKNGNMYQAFYFQHKDKIDAWDDLITHSREVASSQKDDLQRLIHAKESKALLDSFKQWCAQFEDGESFFQSHYDESDHSFYKSVEHEIQSLEYKLNVIIPTILKANTLQSSLVKSFDIPDYEVRRIIDELEERGQIIKEKSGRSYIIKGKNA